MKISTTSPLAVLLAALALTALTLTACSRTPAPRLYVLTPTVTASTSESAEAPPSIGVGPVSLAPHLDRPQIVTRTGNEIVLGALDRWGEPLADGVSRVLSENLGRRLTSDQVWTYPWPPAAAVDIQVTVEVSRCDIEDGEAVFSARWAVYRGGEVSTARRSSFRRPATGPSAAEALSDALAELSREIAEAVPNTPDVKKTLD